MKINRRVTKGFDGKRTMRKIWIAGAIVVVFALAGAAFLQPSSVSAPASGKSSSPPSGTASEQKTVKPSEYPAKDRAALAKAWAEAFKKRDGKAQYALYTGAYQKKVYDEYAALNWVTGTSSPWVESYTTKLTAGGAAVTVKYATSTGPAGAYTVQLKYGKEGGKLKIGAVSEEVPASDAK